MTSTSWLVATTLLAMTSCWSPIAPVPENRRDPGTVVVHVRDTAGVPVSGAWVYIELPNSVGSTFWEGSPTKGDGTVTHRIIPAGRRMFEVRPPAGFAADAPKQEVEVVKDRTVNASFTLRRVS
jgi:hypothetical protein